jgi:poly(3-hydroxybutyrate) depolymerase
MVKHLKNPSVLLSLFCGFLFSTTIKAQIEDIQVGDLTRRMLVYAPSGIESNRPLLLSLHGMNQDINYQQNQTNWEDVAKEHDFVVVYPGGVNNSWSLSGRRDIDFILAIIDEMHNRYEIDRDRVYLSGFSMGGMMTYYAATQIADKIAAFAPVGGYLMRGPNTNSSRPIPIIHTHGTTDDVVPFSGVKTCLDAWIQRNNCPTTAQIIQPYPDGMNSSNATMYSWGPGTDSVEIVLLSLNAVGHWHSIDPNGVNTSQEIWNFCQRFSLGFGVPKFKYASIKNRDPKAIEVSFNLPIKEADTYDGFIVKIDDVPVAIDNIVLADPNRLIVSIAVDIVNSHEVFLTYNDGNVVSVYDKDLVAFTGKIVDNLLFGSQPRLLEVFTNENGDTLLARFNKEMQAPSDISSLSFEAIFNGEINIPILNGFLINDDPTILAFALEDKVFADYDLFLSYSGSNIASTDNGFLRALTNFHVTINSNGLPVNIETGLLENNGFAIALEFSKSMALNDDQLDQLIFNVNGETISIKEFFVSRKIIRFILESNLHYGDIIKLSYNPGSIKAADKGELVAFSDLVVGNPLSIPTWQSIPGTIQAEDFTLQFGTDTEQTSDIGGGINIGWTDSGDWLVYAIENNTNETEFNIFFRVAAQSAGSSFDYYINNVKIGQVNVPNTGGWQSWQSVVKDLNIDQGKHYFKIVVVSGGFTPEFVYNRVKVKVIDMMGKTVINKLIPYELELLPTRHQWFIRIRGVV